MKKSNSQNTKLNQNNIFKKNIILNNNNNENDIEQKIKQLEKENKTLKNNLKLFVQKEKYYLSVINELKEKEIRNEITNSKYHKESKINNLIKKRYIMNIKNTNKLNNDINLLYQNIYDKNEMITSLQNKINSLTEKISQIKLNYYFKEKEYENKIKLEKRKLKEIKYVVNQITNEAAETIKNLSKQIENMPRKFENNDYSTFINNQPYLQIIQNNINQLIKMMSQNNDNNISDNDCLSRNINKNELNLLNNENNKMKNEFNDKKNEIKLFNSNNNENGNNIININKNNEKYINKLNNLSIKESNELININDDNSDYLYYQ